MPNHSNKPVAGIIVVGLCLFVFTPSWLACAGQETHSTGAVEISKTAGRIPDIRVMDQNGQSRNFYTDLVKGKVVAINFIYTTCSTICPPLGATFGKLQKSLGKSFGREVFLISISVDPATDTPERLHSWAAQFGGQPGWTLVTGDKTELNRLLKALGADSASPDSHSPMVLIVNDKVSSWKRVYGLGSTATLTRSIEEMLTPSSSEKTR